MVMAIFQENTDEKLYLTPTPAGAYYAVSRPALDPCRKLLSTLLQYRQTPLLTLDGLKNLTQLDDDKNVMELLRHMQTQGWLQGVAASQRAPKDVLEKALPEILKVLSAEGKSLLADQQGFHLASCGFEPQTVDKLSVLTADLALLLERHIDLLNHHLDLQSSAWGIIDAAGNSQLGFWPLYIGQHRFVLVIGGMPCLNQPALTHLIWALSIRYTTNFD